MKKKKVLTIVALIISVLVIYILLVLFKVLPNPFIDRRDLVCSKEFNEGKVVETTMYFNRDGIYNKFDSIYKSTFKDLKAAQEFYDYLKEDSLDENIKITIEDNVVTESYKNNEVPKEQKQKRRELKKYYEEELFFECK